MRMSLKRSWTEMDVVSQHGVPGVLAAVLKVWVVFSQLLILILGVAASSIVIHPTHTFS